MGTMKYIRARSQRKISTYSKRDSESRRADQFKIPLVYEVVPGKYVGIFIQTSWLDVYSSHVALKVADES